MRIIKSAVREIMKATPYEVRKRRQPPQELPDATFESVKLALAYYLVTVKKPTLLQIGACDGTFGDSIYEFVQTGRIRSVLVEPIEASFRKLQKAYAGVRNVTPVQAAVALADGKATMYKIKDSPETTFDAKWAPQLAGFSKAHLIKHGVREQDIETVEVRAVRLDTLLAEQGFDRLDILQVDTEGFDGEVVKMALGLKVRPTCINFEHVHLTDADLAEVFKKLGDAGYVWTHDGWNTLALHESFTRTLTQPS